MKFLTQSLAYLCIASFAATANANCMTDITADAFQSFVTAMDSAEDDDAADFPALCLGVGGDLFAFSGTTTCGDQVDQHSNDPMCLPTSCTSNEADIALMIPMIIAEEGCTGSYTYDGLGDGTPDSLSCMLDYFENMDTVMDFAGLFMNEVLNEYPDYTAAQTLCEDNDMDYFTASFTQTCVNGSQEDPPIEMKDIPQCFPSSCTSDEAALKAMYADMNSDEPDANFPGPVCTDTDFSFSGLAEVEEEDMTSGGSFRASIAGSVLMLAVASALL